MQVVHRILYHVTEETQPKNCFHVLNVFLFKRKFIFSYSTYMVTYIVSLCKEILWKSVYEDLNCISDYEKVQYHLSPRNFASFIPIYDSNISLFTYQSKELCIGKGRFHTTEGMCIKPQWCGQNWKVPCSSSSSNLPAME